MGLTESIGIITAMITIASTFFLVGRWAERNKRFPKQQEPFTLKVSGTWEGEGEDLEYKSEGIRALVDYKITSKIKQRNNELYYDGTITMYSKNNKEEISKNKLFARGILQNDGYATLSYQQQGIANKSLNYGVILMNFSFNSINANGFFLARDPSNYAETALGKFQLKRIT